MRAAVTLKGKRTEAVTMHDIATLTMGPTRGAVAVRQRPMTHRWTEAISVALASVRSMLATSRWHERLAHRDYPRRYAFLEYASMAREMDRL